MVWSSLYTLTCHSGKMLNFVLQSPLQSTLIQLQDCKLQGHHQEALRAFINALEIEANHVPSLISAASILRQQGSRSSSTARSFLSEALRLDRTNHFAWLDLGLLRKYEGGSASEASDCFQAAVLLKETGPETFN